MKRSRLPFKRLSVVVVSGEKGVSPYAPSELGATPYEPGAGSPANVGRLRRVRMLGIEYELSCILRNRAEAAGVRADVVRSPGGLWDITLAGLDEKVVAVVSGCEENRLVRFLVLRALSHYDAGRPPIWRCGDRRLSLEERPLIMGILNITPDSFSDGGLLMDPGAAEEAAFRLCEEGADIVDVGGESTRPGAVPISAEEELRRVGPVLQRLAGRLPVPLSIDTSRSAVARFALDCGATIVNDVTALKDPEMTPLIVSSTCGVVLMHSQGTPATMQIAPHYEDLIREVCIFLLDRAADAVAAGVSPERIAIDPGIGFGKTDEHNLTLMARLRELTSLGLPVMCGPSRKGFLGRLVNLPANDRVEATLAACVTCTLNGASILRVHDVGAVLRAVKVAAAIACDY